MLDLGEVEMTVRLIGGKWKLLVLVLSALLFHDTRRGSELTRNLRELEELGLVAHADAYALTPPGRELMPAFQQLAPTRFGPDRECE